MKKLIIEHNDRFKKPRLVLLNSEDSEPDTLDDSVVEEYREGGKVEKKSPSQ